MREEKRGVIRECRYRLCGQRSPAKLIFFSLTSIDSIVIAVIFLFFPIFRYVIKKNYRLLLRK